MRPHQLLDLTCSAVESPCQPPHFVAAFDDDTRREIAGTERFDSALQTLQAAADLPHDHGRRGSGGAGIRRRETADIDGGASAMAGQVTGEPRSGARSV